MIRGLGFAGSLRAGSYNRALLRAAVEAAPEELSIGLFDLTPLPLYHADVEAAGDPEPVSGFKSAVREAELVLIATPEYNQNLPAVTKNAVDWGSRPPHPQVWDGKPVAIMGASPGRLGTVGAQRVLREVLASLNAYVMPQPRILLAGAGRLFDEELRLVNEEARERLTRFMEAVAEWALRFRAP